MLSPGILQAVNMLLQLFITGIPLFQGASALVQEWSGKLKTIIDRYNANPTPENDITEEELDMFRAFSARAHAAIQGEAPPA